MGWLDEALLIRKIVPIETGSAGIGIHTSFAVESVIAFD